MVFFVMAFFNARNNILCMSRCTAIGSLSSCRYYSRSYGQSVDVIRRQPDVNLVKQGILPARSTPLIFIHDLFHGAWSFDQHFLEFFSGHGYQCNAIDLRYNYDAEDPLNPMLKSLSTYIRQLHSPPVVIGHGMGGYIAQKLIETQPCRGAILLSSFPPVVDANDSLIVRIGDLGNAIKEFHICIEKKSDIVESSLRVAKCLSNGNDEAINMLANERWFKNYVSLLNADTDIRDTLRAMEENPCLTSRNGIDDIPILVIGAENDAIVTVDDFNDTASFFGVTDDAIIVQNSSHACLYENEWQQFAKHMYEWLNQWSIK